MCSDWDAAQAKAKELTTNYDGNDIETLGQIAMQLQSEFADDQSCAQRRHDRLPMQVRSLWRKAGEQKSERQRKVYQKEAWELLKHHIAESQKHKLERAAKMGRAPRHQPALHKPTWMEIDGKVTEDQNELVVALRKEYNKKWRAFDKEAWVDILNRCLETDGDELYIGDDDIESRWHRLARRGLLREDAVCVEAWRILDGAARPVLRKALQALLASTVAMRSEFVVARVGGKQTAVPRPEATRIIIPGKSVLQMLDVIVAKHVDAWLENQCAYQAMDFVGGRPHMQILDISHGCARGAFHMMDNEVHWRRLASSATTTPSAWSR